MTSRKFARLAAGAAGRADIGLWIVETVLSCCKRHIPCALRGGHRTKENNYSKLSEQKGGDSDVALTSRHAGPAYIITRRRIMYYYKDHSADYLRRTGILMYRCSLFMLPVYLVLYILPLLDEFSPEQLRIFACASYFLLALQMCVQGIACRCYLKNALIAEQVLRTDKISGLTKVHKMMFWAWSIDAAAFMVFSAIGLHSDILSICISLPVLGAVLIVSLALAITTTIKEKKEKNQ